MIKAKIILLLLFSAATLTACAWECEKCGAEVSDTYKYCDRTGCGAKKPEQKSYTQPPSNFKPQPVSTYSTRRQQTRDDPEWYNGKLVKKTPIKIGFLGPELALPLGESYSVFGLYTDPFAASVVNVYGVEIGGCGAGTKKNMYGLAIGGIMTGTATLRGLQIGGLWTASTDFGGVQIGCFNNVRHGAGMQIGVMNQAETFKGVQIGAINYIKNSSVPFFPIINACF